MNALGALFPPSLWCALLALPSSSFAKGSVPAAPAVVTAPGAAREELIGKLRTILDEQHRKQHIAGLAFVAVNGDKVVVLETLGLRDRERKLPVTPDTIFPIGSCTKSFTAIAAAESHDRGALSLDDSPRHHSPAR
jgi:CubicO group peptidase (beta-lactamase class C family)